MGTAGLEIPSLRKLLNKQRIELELLQDDSLGDYCILRLTDARYPHTTALLCYINIGVEPRVARLSFKIVEADYEESFIESESLNLTGHRKDDPEKIVPW
ncbi:MAG TPA: hypothetical protein VEF04_14780, partial [Blastocatellia bacterium]|nr:hypothetical protein [Blastocatellia bacterium]